MLIEKRPELPACCAWCAQLALRSQCAKAKTEPDNFIITSLSLPFTPWTSDANERACGNWIISLPSYSQLYMMRACKCTPPSPHKTQSDIKVTWRWASEMSLTVSTHSSEILLNHRTNDTQRWNATHTPNTNTTKPKQAVQKDRDW